MSQSPFSTFKSNFLPYFVWALILMILFPGIYGGLNYLASTQPQIYRFGFKIEENIPFYPPALIAYFSLEILFLLPLFFLSPNQIHRLGQSLLIALVIAGCLFFLFPAPTLFAREVPTGIWQSPYQILYSVDDNFNTFPSLHICFSFLLVAFLNFQKKTTWFFNLWFILICFSVLLTHQHHMADIAGGILLGYVVWTFRKPKPLST